MEKLKKRYHDASDSLNFSSYDRIKKALKELDRKDIMAFLLGQEAFTMFKRRRKNFPRRKIIRKDIWENMSADLADISALSRFNGGMKWVMLLIDNFSHFTVLIPLKTKGKKDVREGFELAFKQLPCSTDKIKLLHTDRGLREREREKER